MKIRRTHKAQKKFDAYQNERGNVMSRAKKRALIAKVYQQFGKPRDYVEYRNPNAHKGGWG